MIRTSILAAYVLTVPFLAHAQTDGTCSSATLAGTYSLTLTGRAVSSTLVLSNDYQAVGTVTFDGRSAVTANLVANTNQSTGTSQTLSGTYTIPSNCVGAVNITKGETASFTLIPYNNGNDFIITGEDATYELTGTGAPQPTACVTATLSGAYVFSGNGFALGAGAITGLNDVVGLLQFDGAGGINGSGNVVTSTGSVADTLTGHYTLSAACTGSATLTDPSGAGYTLSFSLTTADGSNFALVGTTSIGMFTATAHSTFTNPGAAVGSAAGSGGTPPGSLFSVYGFNLASATPAQPTSSTYPISLGTATVTVNGTAVPLAYTSTGQINAQMPWETTPGVATLVVKTGTNTSNAVAITVPATAAPGIFVSGANRAIAQNFPSYTINSPSAPAPAGSVVIVYLTGGGPVQNQTALTTGKGAPNSVFQATEPYSATVGGATATVDFVGLTPGFIGLYQANIVIPSIAKGDNNLVITIGGTASATVKISTS